MCLDVRRQSVTDPQKSCACYGNTVHHSPSVHTSTFLAGSLRHISYFSSLSSLIGVLLGINLGTIPEASELQLDVQKLIYITFALEKKERKKNNIL